MRKPKRDITSRRTKSPIIKRGKAVISDKAGKTATSAKFLDQTRLSLHGRESQIHYVVPLPKHPKGVRVRESTRWYDSLPGLKQPRNVPFIDDCGKFTGHVVYTWACDERAYIATVVATISRRLEVYARRHNVISVVKRYLPQFVRVAFYYAISKNNYLMDRVLFFLRNLKENGKLIHRVLLKFMSKLNEDIRFVYSHVCSQTKWLLFRAIRPRDKLRTVVHESPSNRRFKDSAARYDIIWSIANAMDPMRSLRI